MATVDAAADLWASVVGQDEVVARLQAAAASPTHAYLLVGEPGYGTRAAARAFAAELLIRGGDTSDEAADRHRRLARADEHPAITVIEREGASISVDQAREVVRQANMAPAEGSRQIFVLLDFHLIMIPIVAGILLKSIEEPPPGTIFVVLADDVPAELVTIASRCSRVDFSPIPAALIRSELAREGVEGSIALAAATSSGGDLDRARLLATDVHLVERRQFWLGLPERLDGTGATAAKLATEALARIEEVLEPLKRAHDAEMAALLEEVEKWGQPKSGIKRLEDRHKREQRRIRVTELKAGLAALADRYRSGIAGGGHAAFAEVAELVTQSCERLVFNPNMELALQSIIVSLPEIVERSTG